MEINTDPKKIQEIITRGVEKVVVKESVFKKLKSEKKLIIKYGIDPTSPNIHLGNAAVLWKLREFQELGHNVVFIVGDFTAQIGDPSGRATARKPLTIDEIKSNLKTYKQQVSKILDLTKTKFVYNSQHFKKLSLLKLCDILQFFSVRQVLERDMFKERIKRQEPIWLTEFIYPIFQAYDSVVVQADIEIGGSDQLFNMLIGRELQVYFNQPPQDIITMKLLLGKDGRKMSKSFGNYIAITDSPKEQYGKIMAIKDELLLQYFELCTRVSLNELKEISDALQSGRSDPLSLKFRLAREVVALYYGKKAAEEAEREFNMVFREKKQPFIIPEIKINKKRINLIELLIKLKLCKSKSFAKRLISQGGVKINGITQKRWGDIVLEKGSVLQVGKKRFIRII